MNLIFEAWPALTGSFRQEATLVQYLNEAVQVLSKETEWPNIDPLYGKTLKVWVIDVFPGKAAPVRLLEALENLLAGDDQTFRETLGASDLEGGTVHRLVFVGNSASIGAWEEERGSVYSIKKDIELYIRMFVSARLAMYVSAVEPPKGNAPKSDTPTPAYVRSAISSFLLELRDLGGAATCRAGTSPSQIQQPLETGLIQLRRSVTDLFSFMQAREGALITPFLGSHRELLSNVNAVYQLGKRSAERAYEVIGNKDRSTLMAGLPNDMSAGTYSLRSRLNQWLRQPRSKRPKEVLKLASKLQQYDLLRDIGRLLSTGVVTFMSQLAAKPGPLGRPRRILLIDQSLTSARYDGGLVSKSEGSGHVTEKLKDLLELINWSDQFDVAGPGIAPFSNGFGDLTFFDATLLDGIKVETFAEAGKDRKIRKAQIDDYDIILVEVDSRQDYVGPPYVHRLSQFIDRVFGTNGPPIIIFTHTESSGDIQQTLNLGAEAYVLKERIYQLPFQMQQALSFRDKHRAESRLTSSFRAGSALKPEIRGKLQVQQGAGYVRGEYLSQVTGEHDSREERWIRELPKADLHCHIGTCVSYAAIDALALNTVSHYFEAYDVKVEALPPQAPAARAALAVILAEWFRKASDQRLPQMVCLALAASLFAEDTPDALPRFALGDKIISWLRKPGDPIRAFEMTALVAALMGKQPSVSAEQDNLILHPQQYFRALSEISKANPSDAKRMAAKRSKGGLFDARQELERTSQEVNSKLGEMLRSWNDPATHQGLKKRYEGAEETLDSLATSFEVAVSKTAIEVEQLRRMASKWLIESHKFAGFDRQKLAHKLTENIRKLHICDHLDQDATWNVEQLAGRLGLGHWQHDPNDRLKVPRLPLSEYVELPDISSTRASAHDMGLQRYLWGADLLGSEHFQYPENLLVAAFAFTLDNAVDNVIYSEVRCETTGYTRCGMTKFGATDLLCRGFDLASLFIKCGIHFNGMGATYTAVVAEQNLPLVRTSVLLAGKRHKGAGPTRDSVALLEYYLQQRPEDVTGTWWGHSRVVGFDISGDESKPAEWMAEVLKPLAVLSSPITIHAGEAADAASIWQAVYQLHARRIGHGLKLRDDKRLLGYCVTEGICMEMCPNSNVFTNGFFPAQTNPQGEILNPGGVYPLRDYLREGLEVAISTDNRYIHRDGRRTLTSEYLTAARLCQGLTRWEVLQIVKAGFKNAFLPKREVAALLASVEERVYRIISRGWY
ncbi:adenosine deaminase family protein [Asticcacaulis benevestitus]|uniref:adenosine deaminase n=1 Tax=Asticcacaulis benevestitus DSM 16100 = ATCC BAA-896 TaxID=1121022 RepID=V4PW22_9CAUL|nr:hypothetical protein [Asticcacaulis benevestitus]ESQ89785.1 hypothetical protein ABENE_13665 [Asticcacaulis benevestitus DSM 16100 = ATCC BAA-896]